jgi:hypothetical protein
VVLTIFPLGTNSVDFVLNAVAEVVVVVAEDVVVAVVSAAFYSPYKLIEAIPVVTC